MSNENLLLKALVKAQQEIKPPKKDKYNTFHKYWYSTLDAIYEAIRGPLSNNGLLLSHSTEHKDGVYTLITTIHHIEGDQLHNEMPLLISKIDSQGLGSSLTYSRRYAICSLLALPTEEDDDGTQAVKQQSQAISVPCASPSESISSMEAQEIENLLSSEDPAYRTNLLKYFGEKSGFEMNNFYVLPKQFLKSIMDSINKRKIYNKKQEMVL